MKITRARLTPVKGGTSEYLSTQGRIKNMLEKDTEENYDFVIDEGGKKSSKKFGIDNINSELVGKTIPIINNALFAKFNEDGSVSVVKSANESVVNRIKRFNDFIIEEGALPQETSVRQLEELRRKSKGTDIGDRITPLGKEGANLQYIKNPLDTGNIESYDDFNKKNKKFISGWNFKRLLSPWGNKSTKTKPEQGTKS